MKKDIFNITVPLNSHGYRIDKFLQSQINELSRTRLQALIRDGQVKLNNIIINSNSKKIGKGVNITHKNISNGMRELSDSINHFKQIKNIYKMIPECQTNFVFAKKNPKSVMDVLGVSGRLVKSGKEVVTAGEIVYGGSQHVGTAVIQVNKKFSEIRSGLNIKYDPKIISKAKKSRYTILRYDRTKEPKKSKQKENSSISWGISNSLNAKSPDVIYHKGDIGKEPMILIFGKNPGDVIRKVSKLRPYH